MSVGKWTHDVPRDKKTSSSIFLFQIPVTDCHFALIIKGKN